MGGALGELVLDHDAKSILERPIGDVRERLLLLKSCGHAGEAQLM
jgi:hypothetical protein